MNRDDVICMARVAGCHDNGEEFRFVELRYLERFFQAAYAAGAAAEREACAKVCEELSRSHIDEYVYGGVLGCAAAIRARGRA